MSVHRMHINYEYIILVEIPTMELLQNWNTSLTQWNYECSIVTIVETSEQQQLIVAQIKVKISNKLISLTNRKKVTCSNSQVFGFFVDECIVKDAFVLWTSRFHGRSCIEWMGLGYLPIISLVSVYTECADFLQQPILLFCKMLKVWIKGRCYFIKNISDLVLLTKGI